MNREISRNGGRPAYPAFAAQRNAKASARRPKERRLEHDPLLRTEVHKGLRLKWSPQQSAVSLRAGFPDDEVVRVSHEAIYQACPSGERPVENTAAGRLRT